MITIIIAVAIPSAMLLFGVISILWIYIIKPRKSIKDGLRDWWNESYDDF